MWKSTWKNSYKLGNKNIEKGNHEKAYQHAIECFQLLDQKYQKEGLHFDLDALNKYFKTVILFKECGKLKKCPHCIEGQLRSGFFSLKRIRQTKELSFEVREKASSYMLNIYQELKHFYNEAGFEYQKALALKELKKELFTLL